jgi:hypothetical protein
MQIVLNNLREKSICTGPNKRLLLAVKKRGWDNNYAPLHCFPKAGRYVSSSKS